eukprot:CAMPEP_0184354400 /NCGR_PEP_ID=MMETSP1089-20130417/88045_1 /TAXON_ID=38269 ORGANISM="Gloeochaete wittrockiana, Strain SAG46.84" /NCGR_SAMPLE_ID=MMETSP1089 /ASSEMBLY_ACC=CAM_ASM_000445 /LENGTH=245 /DNA_ID=CAMNT_0026690377 /DNA_START=218 /DNA_END=955 /DNA_ORIENTATION=+
MAEDWMKSPGGFEAHPHRGFETVTLILEGEAEHHDNRGNSGVLRAGDVQWMTAGSGIVHSEMPHGTGDCHLLQLWLNLPKALKMTPSRYQNISADSAPVRSAPGYKARIISGTSGSTKSPTQTFTPVTCIDLTIDTPGVEFVHDLPLGHNSFLYVIEGSGTFGADSESAVKGDVLLFNPVTAPEYASSELRIRCTKGPLRAFMCDGLPIKGPVAQHGPFVMNTVSEIQEAIMDYRSGRGPFKPIR